MNRREEFERGWALAMDLWRSGETWEAIRARPECDDSTFGCGMDSGVHALMGNLGDVERVAYAHGFTRDQAAALADSAMEIRP